MLNLQAFQSNHCPHVIGEKAIRATQIRRTYHIECHHKRYLHAMICALSLCVCVRVRVCVILFVLMCVISSQAAHQQRPRLKAVLITTCLELDPTNILEENQLVHSPYQLLHVLFFYVYQCIYQMLLDPRENHAQCLNFSTYNFLERLGGWGGT